MGIKCFTRNTVGKKIKPYQSIEHASNVIEHYRLSELNFYDMETYLCEKCGFYHNRKTNVMITREQRLKAREIHDSKKR